MQDQGIATAKPDDTVTKLEQRLNVLRAERKIWESDYQDIVDYVLPRRNSLMPSGERINADKLPRSKRADATATEALNMLADGIMGYSCSPAYPWYRIKSEDAKLNNNRMVRDWYDKVEARLYEALARSKFYSVLPETIADGCGIGTGIFYIDEDEDLQGLQFLAIHPFETFIAEDFAGHVTEVWRAFTMPIQQAKDTFPKAKCFGEYGEDMAPSLTRQIVHVVRKNTGLVPSAFKWESVYYNKESQEILKKGGFYTCPYCVWRYRKNSNETYGRGPAFDSMPDILVLNQVSKALARGVQKATDPPLQAPEKLRGRIKNEPAGITYYMNPDEIVRELQTNSNYQVGSVYHQMLMERVKKSFRADIFMLLEMQTRQKTAEEVIRMDGEKAAILGTIIGRMNAELYSPILKRVFDIEMRAGRIPPPPNGLDIKIKIEFDGPMVQAQKRYHSTNALSQGLGQIASIAQLDPSVRDLVNFDGVARKFIEASGWPATTYRDEDEVAQIRDQQAKAQQAQMQQAMALKQQEMQIKAMPAQIKAQELQMKQQPTDLIAQAAQQQIGSIA